MIPRPSRLAGLLLIALLTLGGATGCASLFGRSDQPQVRLSRDEARQLAAQLATFENTATQLVDSATDEIRANADSRETRNAAARWEETYITRLESALQNESPWVAALDAWQLSERYRVALADGPGKELFGPQQPLARKTSAQLVDRIRTIIQGYDVPPEVFQQLEGNINNAVKKYPLGADFSDPQNFSFRFSTDALGPVGGILKAPLVPLNTVSRVNDTANTLNRFNDTMERFADIAEEYPYVVRAETQSVLRQLHESDVITSNTMAVERVSQSTEKLAQVPYDLPTIVRDTTQQAIEEALQAHDELMATLEEVQVLSADLRAATKNLETVTANVERTTEKGTAGAERVLREAQPTLEEATRTSEALQALAAEAGTTVEKVQAFMASMKPDEPAPPPPEDAEPFRIQDYTETLRALQGAAGELRGVLQELNAGLESPAIDRIQENTAETVAMTAGQVEGLINLVALRVAQIVALAFLLALAFVGIKFALRRKERAASA